MVGHTYLCCSATAPARGVAVGACLVARDMAGDLSPVSLGRLQPAPGVLRHIEPVPAEVGAAAGVGAVLLASHLQSALTLYVKTKVVNVLLDEALLGESWEGEWVGGWYLTLGPSPTGPSSSC